MHDSSDHLPPTAKEIGYFRVTNRSFEDVDRVLSLTDAVNKLKPNSKVLDIGSGLFQHTASGIRKLRSDIFVVSSDATLGLESDHFWIMDSDEDGKGRQTTYSSKANYISDPQKLMSESYQQDRRNEAVNSIASLQPSLPFAADSFDLIIDSWGPGMYLDRTSSDPTRNSHMSVYLDNICRILKHQGEF